jgi:hypothetical protein
MLHLLLCSLLYAAVCCVLCCIYTVVTGDLVFQEHDGSPVVQPVISCRIQDRCSYSPESADACIKMSSHLESSLGLDLINCGEIDLLIPDGRPDALRVEL